MSGYSSNNNSMDMVFRKRLESGLATVRGWEEDVDLLREIRNEIIMKLKYNYNDYDYDDDNDYVGDDLLLKRLCRYFPKHIMEWMNQPKCDHCGSSNTTSLSTIRGPTSILEMEGQANRVEVYNCSNCGQMTTFPRYNSVQALWHQYYNKNSSSSSRGKAKGRCGEYANLFGCICRAMGYEVRYISDFTDHVWVECWSDVQQCWIMADACEGQIQLNGMYEQGWGKSLNYILAFTPTTITDVTRRYTRQFLTSSFQQRRRTICSSESYSQQLIATYNHQLQQQQQLTTTTTTNNNNHHRRIQMEQDYLQSITNHHCQWQPHEYNTGGRISGSYAWKASRHELGNSSTTTTTTIDDKDETKNKNVENGRYYHVEHFWPSTNNDVVDISVSYDNNADCIQVSGVSCGIGLPNSISIVTIDETNGCILTSRSFINWNQALMFCHSIPNDRILLISSNITTTSTTTPTTATTTTTTTNTNNKCSFQQILSRLGGLTFPDIISSKQQQQQQEEGLLLLPNNCNLLYIGQVNRHPQWSTCTTTLQQTTTTTTTTIRSIQVSLSITSKNSMTMEEKQLQVLNYTVPKFVSKRLPETIMPLATQLLATSSQKRQAFQTYINTTPSTKKKEGIVGYTTKPNCPIYLLTNQSFPFCQTYHYDKQNNIDNCWKTHYFLPSPLITTTTTTTTTTVNDENNAIMTAEPKYDIPVDTSLLQSLFGPTLLRNNNTIVSTVEALNQSKLVALYFSAHWCPPCKRFTPILCEFYNHIQEQIPYHGMQVIFISSDRDEPSFQQYFSTMPWLALPYDNNRLYQQMLSQRFGIQGIPALVVLDTMSGEVVVSKENARNEVMNASRGGDIAITKLVQDYWMSQVPEESQMILQTLELSCQEEEEEEDDNSHDKESDNRNPYLTRDIQASDCDDVVTAIETKDPAVRIKELFTTFVAEGMEPNAAAAKAIQSLSNEQQQKNPPLSPGNMNGTVTICHHKSNDDKEQKEEKKKNCPVPLTNDVMHVAQKYLKNVMKHPHNPKFRRFKLSNKVFDRIVSIDGGLDQLIQIGFFVYNTETDFYASIPLDQDLDAMKDIMTSISTTTLRNKE